MYNTLYPINMKPYIKSSAFKTSKKEDAESSMPENMPQISDATQQNEQNNSKYQKYTYPNGQKSSIDYSHTTVNISQIITDFKNTTAAIGAPIDIKQEVDGYLSLIEIQSQKNNPNSQVIQSNLKSASKILDNYITEALNKKSNVVENWIDALFLQNIDFKANASAINPDFQVKLPKNTGNQIQERTIQDDNIFKPQVVSSNPNVVNIQEKKIPPFLPQDKEIRQAFIQGKKYLEIDNPKKAINAFEKALKLSEEKQDKNAPALIYMELAKIYDGYDLLPQALSLYSKASENTRDNSVKMKAHYSMGKIYDDAVQFQPAMEHYFTSIAYAGEEDKLKTQTASLINIANMYTERYNSSNADEYFTLAQQIAQEANSDTLIAKVYKNSANAMSSLNENQKAIEYFQKSSKYFQKVGNQTDLADNYEKASEIMLKLGNTTNAKDLLVQASKIYANEGEIQKAFSLDSQIMTL